MCPVENPEGPNGKDPKYSNKEHPKVQSAGSSLRRNKVDPGPGSDGSGRKY